ncbi:MAG: radical SAM protein [Candidatus Omnitrophica bacterium]|nr:radical SAM protein [Candidatus Omnitrophota bacterium]
MSRPPMDLMMMASSLEEVGAECKIKDYPIEGGSWPDFKEDFCDFNPDLLILSVTTPTLRHDLISCRIAKEIKPGVLTIAKGAHFLVRDCHILEEFGDLDIIIRGENEAVIKEILINPDRSGIAGITYRDNRGIRRNQDRPFLEDLAQLPLPARHLVKNRLYARPDTAEPMAVIETSRGCPGNCIFCLVGEVAGKKIRNRSTGSIVGEIKECIDKYNIRNFHFKSDTFTWNKEWVLELCEGIIERKLGINWICNSRVDTLDRERISRMKKAGCWAVGLGIESGNQEILERIKKGITLKQSREAVRLCKEYGIKTYAYFIIGFPWDNRQTINDSVKFAAELDPDFADFFLPYPFPGTELEKIALEAGLIKETKDAKAYSEAAMDTFFLTNRELLKLRKTALRKFYFRPGYILKTLGGADSPKVFWNYFRHGLKTLRKII